MTKTATDHLTKAQRDTVEHYQAYNVPARWYYATATNGTVEVVAIGDGFVWSFLILPNGDCSSSEAPLGEWETGLNI